jgi:hypothetical protein
MAIGSDQREYMMRTLKSAIATYYGDSVPTLDVYKNRKRSTFMDDYRKKVNAQDWLAKISESKVSLGNANGSLTRLSDNRTAKQAEMNARHQQEQAELRAKQEREKADLIAHYEPSVNDARQLVKERQDALNSVVRQSYFAGRMEEDDGRSMYHDKDIEAAVREMVDGYINNNLMNDAEGAAVLKRIEQERLLSDVAYIAGNMKELRQFVLDFITAKELPPITVKAWLIVDGKDITTK